MLSVLPPSAATQQRCGYPLTQPSSPMEHLRNSPMEILRHNDMMSARPGQVYRLDSISSTQSEDSCSSTSTYNDFVDIKQEPNSNNPVFTSNQGKEMFFVKYTPTLHDDVDLQHTMRRHQRPSKKIDTLKSIRNNAVI